ncbi:MAG: isochorismatase family protein [Candidatus Omnitrophica bacterium]|nr:isochorismatase family protein [Candidatus Omnitrophota bacterium]
MPRVAFFDVDTQFDFINPQGKLSIKGATKIISNLKSLTKFANRNNITVFSSLDSHKKNDPEFKTFPSHCIRDSRGQKKIPVTLFKRIVFIGMKELKRNKITSLLKRFKQIIIEKDTYTVFANPNTKKLITGFDTFYVYGVALDYCVRACCLGLKKYKKKVFLITDATKEVNSKLKNKVIKELRKKGVRFLKTKDILSNTI